MKAMKKRVAHLNHAWFLWIGGACFLAGSLVAGSYGLASSATTGPSVSGTVVANQGTPGSSSWPVAASQSGTWQQELTDGTNVLGTPTHPVRTDPTGTTAQPVSGTVGVASPTVAMDAVQCSVGNSSSACLAPLYATQAIVSTLSVQCDVAPGDAVYVALNPLSPNIPINVPLAKQGSGFDGRDVYNGSLSQLEVSGNRAYEFEVFENYTAAGNGANCTLSYTGPTS